MLVAILKLSIGILILYTKIIYNINQQKTINKRQNNVKKYKFF